MKKLEDYIINIPDFPKKGIIFRDITGILQQKEGYKLAIDGLLNELVDVEFDAVIGAESRGFIFASPIAYERDTALILARKKGKLLRETISVEYELEYGTDILEINKDAIKPGDRIVIVDDIIATGGTTEAIIKMVEQIGATVVKILYVVELEDLGGRDRLNAYNVASLIKY